MSTLNNSSFIVLGFLDCFGPATSYDLKRWADSSVGYFWDFSRTQLYNEPIRLADRDLLTVSQEDTGRNRRIFTITERGRETLSAWMNETSEQPIQLRDSGLLKLYFAGRGSPQDLRRLCDEQVHIHNKRLVEYLGIRSSLTGQSDAQFAIATLEMGSAYETAAVEFWQRVGANVDAYFPSG